MADKDFTTNKDFIHAIANELDHSSKVVNFACGTPMTITVFGPSLTQSALLRRACDRSINSPFDVPEAQPASIDVSVIHPCASSFPQTERD